MTLLKFVPIRGRGSKFERQLTGRLEGAAIKWVIFLSQTHFTEAIIYTPNSFGNNNLPVSLNVTLPVKLKSQSAATEESLLKCATLLLNSVLT